MALYAIKRIDDAVSLTRSLLFPFDVGLWARLAVVVFFLGLGSGGGNVTSSVSNVPSVGSSAGSVAPGADVSVEAPSIPADALAILAAVAVVLFVVWLLFAWIGATMEFVFVESLSEQAISIREGFGRHRGRGVRLLAFRLALIAVTLGLLGGLTLALFWDPITTLLAGGDAAVSDSRLAVGIGILVLVGVVIAVPAVAVHLLTTEFVVPIMLVTDSGVLAGWGRLWPTIKAQWKQYVVYVLVAVGLRIATSIAGGIVLAVVAIVLAIPFVIVGLLFGFGAVASGSVTTVMIVGAVLLAVAFFLLFTLAGAAVYVPIQSFLRYFALLFIGDIEPEFDVLGELRPASNGDSVPSPGA